MSFSKILRKGAWFLRVLGQTVASRIQRTGRRLLGKPPRIVHGTEALHMIHDMVKADRIAGFDSISVVKQVHRAALPLFRDLDFDVVLSRSYPADEWHWASAHEILRRADIWVTCFDSLFFPPSAGRRNDLLFALLKWSGVRIIALPNGMDVIHVDGKTTRFDFMDRLRMDYSEWDIEGETPDILARIERYFRYADLVIGGDTLTDRFLPRTDFTFKYFALDMSRTQPKFSSSNRIPAILHAPNHRNIKGTDILISAVASLRERGVECALSLVEHVPRDEAMRLYAEADILTDQLIAGAFGVFAVEGLALGKPVLTYLDEETLRNPIFNLPIVNANADNLERVLEVLIALPVLRERLGRAGRTAAEKYQSCEALAEVWALIYNHVWSGTPLNLHQTVHFSESRTGRSLTEDPADKDFWPVPVDDLLPEIESVLHGRAA